MTWVPGGDGAYLITDASHNQFANSELDTGDSGTQVTFNMNGAPPDPDAPMTLETTNIGDQFTSTVGGIPLPDVSDFPVTKVP